MLVKASGKKGVYLRNLAVATICCHKISRHVISLLAVMDALLKPLTTTFLYSIIVQF